MVAGRPSSYRKEFAKQAEKLCELGATDMELAVFFEVNVSTIYRWKHTQPKFCEALKVGKDFLDDRVERSLYQRAVGYSFNSEKVFHHQGTITRADTIACACWSAMSWLKTVGVKNLAIHVDTAQSLHTPMKQRVSAVSGCQPRRWLILLHQGTITRADTRAYCA